MRIAGVQMDVALGAVAANLGRMEKRLAEAAGQGAKLVVFPECAATGYCFESAAEAREVAEPIPGPITERMSQLCREHGTYTAFGMVELDADRLFNAAVLVGPEGVLGSYRKIHLPYLGLDMFTTPGDRLFRVDHVGNVRVGMTICYDGSFPESTRSLALLGADLILLPTNWPPGAETTAEYVTNARAVENNVYFMAVNRVGTERGFRFIGHSKIAGPHGNTLAEARGTDEQILYAEIDPHLARRKHLVRVPGKHEIDRMADRRPEMYGLLTEPHHLRSPGR
ncbi:MAG: carbon-nitrogen hydrolase family protein [Pirellulales bacterium]